MKTEKVVDAPMPAPAAAAARAAGARRLVWQSFAGWPYARSGAQVKTEDDPLDPEPPADARATLAVRDEMGSLDAYLWRLAGGAPAVNRWRGGDIPAETPASRAMSKDLKRRGFRFVGPTVCYAFMQTTGMVNDHVTSCFRYAELGGH